MKKILITGASGLLGSTLLSNLFQQQQSDYSVVGTYLSYPIEVVERPCFQVDLTNKQVSEDLLNHVRPEIIIHAAASVNVDECEVNPELAQKMNVSITENMVSWAKKHGAKLVHVSTDAFFEGPIGKKFTEQDQPMPLNKYGETKLWAEQMVRNSIEDHLILRTNFFGWNLRNKSTLAEWILSNLRAKNKIACFKDVFFTTILTQNFSKVLEILIEKNEKSIWNLVGSESVSKYEFALKLAQVFELDTSLIEPVLVESHPFKARRSKNMSLDNSKVLKLCGASNEDLFSLESGLKKLRLLERSKPTS